MARGLAGRLSVLAETGQSPTRPIPVDKKW